MANISTLIGGVVKDIYVLEGTFVSKGKRYNHSKLEVTEMQEDYNSAMANIEYLQLEYNRKKTGDENVNPARHFRVKIQISSRKSQSKHGKKKVTSTKC
jgi:cobalt-zinc-cadmium efflux system membrane fusion protein